MAYLFDVATVCVPMNNCNQTYQKANEKQNKVLYFKFKAAKQ